MKIRGYAAGTAFIVLMIGGILLSMATSYWATESSKEPVTYETGDFAGEYNPADIRGSYSFGDIEKAFSIPVDTLAAAFGLSGEANPEAVQVKTFEEVFGIIDGNEIGTDSMRYFVALYKGLPYTPEEGTVLPRPAISILRKEGAMTEEDLNFADEHAVSLDGFRLDDTAAAETHDETAEDKVIKGKTLFSELYDWGLSKEEVQKVLGMAPGASSESVRDFCTANNIEFTTVKEPLQVLLDSK